VQCRARKLVSLVMNERSKASALPRRARKAGAARVALAAQFNRYSNGFPLRTGSGSSAHPVG
jgi:hypothetical protein